MWPEAQRVRCSLPPSAPRSVMSRAMSAPSKPTWTTCETRRTGYFRSLERHRAAVRMLCARSDVWNALALFCYAPADSRGKAMRSPSQQIMRLGFGFAVSQALRVIIELGIPDLLAIEAQSVDELATATQSDADALYRVMRLLAS